MNRIDPEDIALLISVIASIIATLIDEIAGSTIFKGLKIVALAVTLGLTISRIRTSRPFVKDFGEGDWSQIGTEYEILVPRSIHKRGRHPTAVCLTKDDSGGYAECNFGASIQDDGDISIREPAPGSFRLEVRKH